MKNWKRFVILGVTAVAAILTIILGSVLYVGKPGNIKKSAEYGGGVKYVVQVNSTDHSVDASDVAKSIYERIDNLGVGGADISTGHSSNGTPTVTVEYPGLSTEEEKNELQENIIHKPHLVFTDIFGNPLFNEYGKFDKDLLNANNKLLPKNNPSILNWESDTKVPLESNGAKAIFDSNEGKWKVSISLLDANAINDWTLATKYISQLPNGTNSIVTWLDPKKYIDELKKWNFYTGNMYNDAYVSPNGKLRKYTIDSSKYLISSASVKNPLSGKDFVLEGNFSSASAHKIAEQLNFGSASYSLKLLSKLNFESTYGTHAFNKAMLAGIIVIAVIALFLIVNYGLLGALSTISISLFIFLTLLMFTIMRGEYSPESIAALIIGIGMSVDANIITFERLKSEVYSGSSLKKANKKANKGSLSSIFDANITTLIVAFVLFYFGTKSIRGLSITLIISIFFTLIIMLGFTRIMSSQLVNSGIFEKKRYWLGIKPKIDMAIQKNLNKPDYVKRSNIFNILSASVISIALIVFAIFAGIAGTMSKGMNLSKDFTGGSDITIQKGTVEKPEKISDTEFANIKTKFSTIPTNEIYLKNGIVVIDSRNDYSTEIQKIVDPNHPDILITNENNSERLKYHISSNIVTNEIAKQLVKDAMLAIVIAIALIVLYILIRFRWTYSFAAIIALVHDGLIVTAVFILARVEISPVFIAGLLSVLGYSINDTIVTFDRIREHMKNNTKKLDKKNIKTIANNAIKDTIKRSILTSFTTVIAIIVLMCFNNATKLSFNIAMLSGLIAGTYSSIFIATYFWVKLETRSQLKSQKREKNKFWKIDGIDEQTIPGINDFKA